ncbi:[Fe-Fe] hydrogenase large subunit C-terminal domain-containing protein [uncultured Thomasclavelia sp.]|uniref:[Fe-Fe] hydrogenase large subunit C-terminal domain-containing protein n=1 Tax=uncultured Thomasclavelia sp. TaxID=3025759 RepID=UPI0025D1D871|nr:[Fe-Fe] hydrogenase large subunit C-terminal domain-containing protein [uncultured Thomasclavelia sp.]
MKPVINYLGSHCSKCIKCVKSCPVDAISIVNEQVIIDNDKCINCDICIQACDQKILRTKNIDLESCLKKHEYNVALIPTAILSDLKTYQEAKNIAQAIKKFGFDEVVQYSDIEGFLYKQAIADSQDKHLPMLTSFCPTINKLIANEYPTLIDHLLPYDYPVEIAAKQIRKKHADMDVGIFSLCECVGKLTLAKEPFDNQDSNIDFAISISQVFPQINKLKNEETSDIDFNRYGIKSNVSDLYGNRSLSVISVEGLQQINTVLDLIEFDQLKHVDLIALFNCFQGCIGGYYLWSNPFEGCFNIESIFEDCNGPLAPLSPREYRKIHEIDSSNEQNFKERLAWFNKVNTILETLPQFDCGSCGFANCRGLAARIASGEVDDSLCRVKKR